MGNEASSPHDEDYPDEYAKFDGIETLAYRVLGVQPNSPASQAGLVSFLDFLVGCNGEMLMGSGEGLEEGDEYEDIDFPALLKDNVGKELTLLVHNIKSNSQRLVKITPSSAWGGAGLLGVTIRLDNYGGADERLIRVLSVEHNSPAAVAGLVPMKDYLLGTTSASFDSGDILAEVLMVHADRIVEFYVYSSESDVVRVVTLMPTLSWGGRGLLGAEIGTGYLHGFPKSCRETDGASVERKVRVGGKPSERPTETIQKGGGTADGAEKKEENEPNGPPASGEMVDLTALTDTLSGKAMSFAPTMEMEPAPEVEPVARGEQQSNQSSREGGGYEQEPSQSSAETTTQRATQNGQSSNETSQQQQQHFQHQSPPKPGQIQTFSVFDYPPPGDTSPGGFATPQQISSIMANNGQVVPPPPYASPSSASRYPQHPDVPHTVSEEQVAVAAPLPPPPKYDVDLR